MSGGVKTLEDLKRRCRIDEDSECWLWLGTRNRNGAAKVNYTKPSGERMSAVGRRVALVLRDGVEPGSDVYAIPRLVCEHKHCVNPDHATFGSRKQLGAYIRKTGIHRGLASKMRASKENGKKNGKLSLEIAREIRALELPQYRIAEMYGIARSTVQAIQRGRLWSEGASNSSVFTWRPAA